MDLNCKYRGLIEGLYRGERNIGRAIGYNLRQDGEDGKGVFAQLLFEEMSHGRPLTTVTVGTLRDISRYSEPQQRLNERITHILEKLSTIYHLFFHENRMSQTSS